NALAVGLSSRNRVSFTGYFTGPPACHHHRRFACTGRGTCELAERVSMSAFERLSGERIVVTGGAGFVGSNIVRRLLREGARVVVLDDFYTGTLENLPADEPGMEIVRGTVTDYELVRDVVKDAAVVFHEAARNIIVSTRNPREDYE